MAAATSWDPLLQDFVEVSVPDGTAFPFVLDLARGKIAYQASSSSGVLSAFQALLNATKQARWRVERILQTQTWPEWRASVERVTELRLRLHRPNPNYVDRERVEDLIESVHAEVITIVATARPDDLEGLDLEAVYIQQAIDHAVNKKYGTLTAKGQGHVDSLEVERRYNSQAVGSEIVQQRSVDPVGVVPAAELSDAVASVSEDGPTEVADEDEDS